MTQRLLPDGWVETTLSLLGSIQTGKTPSTKVAENFGGDILFVKPADLDNGGYINTTQDTLTQKGLDTIPKLPPKAIMVTCIGNLGKVGITTQVCATNQQINSVIPNGSVVFYKYLYYCLLSLKNWLDDNSSATTVAIINKTRFSKAPIPLPSLAEQRHIATVLDDSLAMVAQIRERLDSVQQQLKRFRQSVLADAVSGRLTADWHRQNNIVEWQNIKLSKMAKSVTYGYTASATQVDTGVRFVRITDLHGKGIDWDSVPFCEISDEDFEKFKLEKNDLLFARMGSVGKSHLIKSEPEKSVYASYLIRVRLRPENDINYLAYYFQSPQYWLEINDLSSGIGRASVNGTKLKNLDIPLPPLPEQQEIVRRVDALFAHAEQIEQRMTVAMAQVEQLVQSLLAAAFDGSLSRAWRDANQALITGEHSAAALLAQLTQQPSTKARTKKSTKTAINPV